jgi:drug/metabolite transporter (DMT)-like permease
VAATVGLGSVSAGFVVVLMSVLVGRVGAARGGITMYFIPIVAIVLGVAFRGESVALVALAGIGLVLAGAFLTSRIDRAQLRAMTEMRGRR